MAHSLNIVKQKVRAEETDWKIVVSHSSHTKYRRHRYALVKVLLKLSKNLVYPNLSRGHNWLYPSIAARVLEQKSTPPRTSLSLPPIPTNHLPNPSPMYMYLHNAETHTIQSQVPKLSHVTKHRCSTPAYTFVRSGSSNQ